MPRMHRTITVMEHPGLPDTMGSSGKVLKGICPVIVVIRKIEVAKTGSS